MSNSKTKFTRGVWKFNSIKTALLALDKNNKHRYVYNASPYNSMEPSSEDAALIAAAPEMYSALESGIEQLMRAYKMTSKLELQDHPYGASLNELVMRLNENFKDILKVARGEK